MKKGIHLNFLILIFLFTGNTYSKAQNNVSICLNGDLAVRIEHQTYVCLSPSGQVTGIGIPVKGNIAYFNGRISSCDDKSVSYDFNNRIDRIGSVTMSYFNGHIDGVGPTSVSYFNGKVDRIGNKSISYFVGHVDNIGATSISYFNERIDRIGDESISYFNGRIDKIGAKSISYDVNGLLIGVDDAKFTYDSDKNINHLDLDLILGITLSGYWTK